MPDNIDHRISLALDPGTYREMEGYTDETAKFVASAIHAFTDAHHTLSKLHDARELWANNMAVTPENRILIVAKEAQKHRERVFKRFDLASQDLTANIAHTEKLLSEPLTQRAGVGTLNDAVRAHVKELERPEREAFMRNAFEEGDELTLEAVLGAPYYLSGFTKIDHDYFIRTYHEQKNPHLVKRLDLMKRFLEKLDNIGPILNTQFNKSVGAKPNEAEAIRIANDRAVAALKIEPTA